MKNDERGPADDATPKGKGKKKASPGKDGKKGSASRAASKPPAPPVTAEPPSSIETFIDEPAPTPPAPDQDGDVGDVTSDLSVMWISADGEDIDAATLIAADLETSLSDMGAMEVMDTIAAIEVMEAIELMDIIEPLESPEVVLRRAPLKVGLIVGREWSFPPKFIEEVNNRDEGVIAEYVKLGAEHMDDPCEYAVIIDRISHEVPFYRTYLKHAVLQGATVVNNPLMWSADDKFLGASLITKLGVASPKTAVLPNKNYVPGIVPSESLRNLKFPLDWKALIEYVGLPCILKDAHGGGWKEVYVCRSLDELIHHYDNSGLLTMIVQEFIEWDQFVRCLCIGQEDVLPMKYDPRERRYLVEHEHLGVELGNRVVRDALTIVRALGYDMNSIEFAVRDGIPYAIDFMNPAPDMDLYSLTPHYFEWAVTHMADMAIRLAKAPRRQAAELGWTSLLTGTRTG